MWSLTSLLFLLPLTIASPLPLPTSQPIVSEYPISSNVNSSASALQKQFYVDPKKIPGISEYVTIADSWAGNLPISASEPDRTLYFWLVDQQESTKHHEKPQRRKQGSDDLVVWMNGGPGCSSLIGALNENGPFQLRNKVVNGRNVSYPVANPNSWNTFATVLYLEAPVGVGFTQGQPRIVDNDGFARDFVGFMQSFYSVFPEMLLKNLYIVGESYGSYYSMYSAQAILKAGANLKGFGIVDGVIANDEFNSAAVLQYVKEHNDDLHLNQTTIDNITSIMERQGFGADYIEKTLKYPQQGPITLPPQYQRKGVDDPRDVYYNAALDANPCFDIYHISGSTCRPDLTAPLEGLPTNNNTDFGSLAYRKAMHMPTNTDFHICSPKPVFVGGPRHNHDQTPFPADTARFGEIMTDVSKAGGRIMIMHGGLDGLLIYNATALGIQNTTYNGAQGFQKGDLTPLRGEDGGDAGHYHMERDLTLAYVKECGHGCPQYVPDVANKLVRYMMRQIDEKELSS